MMRPNSRTCPLLATLLLGNAVAHAETYTFAPGDDWAKIGPRLVAGDEVVLLEGVHVPAHFENVSGEPGKPIVIRASEKIAKAEIAASREGIRLTNCRHVRIERMQIKGARRAGIVVDAIDDGRSEDIAVHDSVISGVSGLVEQAGILVIATDGFDARRTRIENCTGSAMRFENSNAISCERLQLRTTGQASSAAGMLFLGTTDRIEATDVIIDGRFTTGISLAAKDAPRPPRKVKDPLRTTPEPTPTGTTPSEPVASEPTSSPPPSPINRLVANGFFSSLLVRGCDRAFELGPCSNCLVTGSSLVDSSEEIIRLVQPVSGTSQPSIRFRTNIVAWQPGGLRRLVDAPERVDATQLVFDSNLWWSKELPDALARLGPAENPFVGTVAAPQTTDLDPGLDQNGVATVEAAKLFGRNP